VKNIFYLIISLVFQISYQILLKYTAISHQSNSSTLLENLFNIYLLVALISAFISFYFWFKALKKIPLSIAYAWTGIIYIFVPFIGNHLFNENLSKNYLIGIICIIIGLLLVIKNHKII
jgi:multidrug transporter EmrE-like cation transporter